jgi:CDP-glucose 4,6-dehydratase
VSLVELFRAQAPEIVFHMAAQPLVRRSYRDPVGTYETNVMGTVRVLETIRTSPSVRAVVIVTSDKCYDNREQVWGYREEEAIGGRDPYSSSKGCAELITAAYRASFFGKGRTAVASARAGNVIGGGDWADDRLVPDIVRAIASSTPIVLRRPIAIRPWQHVLDPVRGYLVLAERLWEKGQAFAEPWNFGPRDEDAVPVRELAGRIVRCWQAGWVTIDEDPDVLEESTYLKLDCSKARSRLGWTSLLSLDEAVELTIDWYRAYLKDSQAAARVMGEQLQGYMERCARDRRPVLVTGV